MQAGSVTEIPSSQRNLFVAGLLSVLVPGLGQVYNAQPKRGIVFYLLSLTPLFFFLTTFCFRVWAWLVPGVFALGLLARIVAAIEAAVSAGAAKPVKSYNRWWVYIALLGLHFGFALFVSGSHLAARSYSIPSGSMIPTLVPGDYVMADMTIYKEAVPENGDIIIFDSFDREGLSVVCRVVAGPGQSVGVSGGRLMVDGEVRKYGEEEAIGHFESFSVPDDAFFVVGDNINNARDSRFIGPVPRAKIRGKVRVVFWPPARVMSFGSE